MFCKFCGKEMLAVGGYCEHCGEKLDDEYVAAAQTETEAPAVPEEQPTATIPPVPVEVPTGKGKKEKKKVSVVAIVLLAVLALLVAGAVALAVMMFPAKITADAGGKLKTTTGKFDKVEITVTSNQPIVEVKYALDPDDPTKLDLFTDAEAAGGMLEKTVKLKDLIVPPGEAVLHVYVKTWFGEQTEQIKLTCDIGKIAAPDPHAIVETNAGSKIVVNELLVYFADGTSSSAATSLIESYGGEVVGQVYMLDEYQARFETSSQYELESVKSSLEAEDSVELISYNMVIEGGVSLYPDDSEYDDWDTSAPAGNNWALECIDAPGAWEYLDKMSPVMVGVIDSALDYDHEDLNIDPDNSFVLATDDFQSLEDLMAYYDEHADEHSDCRVMDCVFCGQRDHGSHVSGIIAADGNNGKGVAGVNWNADISFSTCWYYTVPSEGDLAMYDTTAGINYAITRLVMSGCRVVNLSVGATYPTAVSDEETSAALAYDRIVAQLTESGYDFLVVKAAGNSADDASDYMLNRILTTGESAAAHSIVVGAVEHWESSWSGTTQYSMAYYSNYGSLIDVTAPGSDWYSTVYDGYDYMDGTSMAAPTVSGVASLLYSVDPTLTYDQVKSIVCSQTELFTAKGGRTYPIVNARMAVEYVIENGGGNPEVQLPVAGFVTGLIQDAVTEDMIPGASVLVTDSETGESQMASVMEGTYYVYLAPGTYDLEFSAEGYLTETVYGVEVLEGVVSYNVLLNMVEEAEAPGGATGSVLDAFNAEGIPNATIKVYKGVNNTAGTPIGTSTSDEYGRYTLTLAPGNYTLSVSAAGYTTGTATVVVVAGTTISSQDCTLTPILESGTLRVVLTWGETPTDLDSHMVGPTPAGDEFHVFYSEKNYWYDGSDMVNLDVDDTTSYGPETTTVYESVEGRYTFYIHDYSNRGSSDSNAMANSGAQVKVYVGGRAQPYVFNVPTEDGTLWEVFTFEDGILTPVNEMSYYSDPYSVGE